MASSTSSDFILLSNEKYQKLQDNLDSYKQRIEEMEQQDASGLVQELDADSDDNVEDGADYEDNLEDGEEDDNIDSASKISATLIDHINSQPRNGSMKELNGCNLVPDMQCEMTHVLKNKKLSELDKIALCSGILKQQLDLYQSASKSSSPDKGKVSIDKLPVETSVSSISKLKIPDPGTPTAMGTTMSSTVIYQKMLTDWIHL